MSADYIQTFDGTRVPLSAADKAQRAKDAATVAAGTNPKFFISKVEMWKRCTDDEAEKLYSDLRQAPARYQALFDGATVIDTRDDFFPVLHEIVVNRVGADRAAVILEPTS